MRKRDMMIDKRGREKEREIAEKVGEGARAREREYKIES